jgi:cyclohexadienyl dehydratase
MSLKFPIMPPTLANRLVHVAARRLLAAALCCAPLAAHAGAVLDHIRASGELRVGTTGDYKPFSFRDADGGYSGADVEMARRLAAKLGVKPVFVATTWPELAHDYTAGHFDIAVGGITKSLARAALGPFANTLLVDGKRPIVRCADRERLNSLTALDRPEVRVIVNPGASNEAFAHKELGAAQLTVHGDNATIFDEIAAGRADAMVTDGVEVDHQSRLHAGVLCPADVATAFTHDEKAYWLQPDTDFEALVDHWLDEEIASGAWRGVLDRALARP